MVQHKTHGFYICSRQNEFEGDVLSQKFISAYANKNYVTIDNTLLENKKSFWKENAILYTLANISQGKLISFQ